MTAARPSQKVVAATEPASRKRGRFVRMEQKLECIHLNPFHQDAGRLAQALALLDPPTSGGKDALLLLRRNRCR